jgi:hypothetical protein
MINVNERKTVIFTRALPWVLAAYVLFMFGVSLAGIGHLSYYGDEFIHVEKLRTFFEHGLYTVRVGFTESGEMISTFGHVYIYGPLFSLIAHVVAVIFGVESWGVVDLTDSAFAVRHYVVAAFSFVTVFAAGWGVTLITRSRTWGLVAASILVSIPMWTGAAMFNVKDIPLATGFTLLTSGCIALTVEAGRESRFARTSAWLGIFSGSLLIWGVRPGFWTAIVLFGIAMFVIHARLNNFSQWKNSFRALVFPASAVLAAYLTMVFVYPKVFLNPITLLAGSVSQMTKFGHEDIILTDGEFLSMPPPWYYLPKWLAAQLPELIGVMALVAFVVTAWLLVRRFFQSSPGKLDDVLPAMLFVFIQMVAYPLAAIVLQSRITSGVRQFLFIIPAMSMLITVVFYLAVQHFVRPRINLVWGGVGALLIASTALTTFIQLQLSPYMSSYFNPTTVERGISERWEVYAKKLSGGELYSLLTPAERLRCRKCPKPDTYPASLLTNTPNGPSRLNYWEIARFPLTRTSVDNNKNCNSVIAEVQRPYLWYTFPVTRASACDLKAGSLDKLLENPDDGAKWWATMAKWGWAKARAEGVTTLPGAPSALTWSVESLALGETPRYVLTVSALPGSTDFVTVSTTVNGIRLDDVVIAAGDQTDLAIEVPAPTIDGAPDDLVVVEFVLSDANGSPVTNTLQITAIRPMS